MVRYGTHGRDMMRPPQLAFKIVMNLIVLILVAAVNVGIFGCVGIGFLTGRGISLGMACAVTIVPTSIVGLTLVAVLWQLSHRPLRDEQGIVPSDGSPEDIG